MLIGFHFGMCCTDQAMVSEIRRMLGAGGNTYVPRDRYSLTMSFWVVPASWSRGAPCSSATATYRASSHIAGALIVIEVLASAIGMPSNSVRMSPMWLTGTPTLPTSPFASSSSGS
jgi:hypothetical protein